MESNVYDRLGVRRCINAASWLTVLGGSIMPPEVIKAMADSAPYYVDVPELLKRGGEIIAQVTGAEAGMVTSGAAGGQVAMAAACMTGTDPAKVARLPDATGMKHEFIIMRQHRNHYDSNFLVPGGKFVEVGKGNVVYPWEIENAINDNTAAVAFVVAGFRKDPLPLKQVVEIAHKRGVPVIVDAAATVPPAENLRKFTAEGADMVTYSGGKGLRGPQSTGLLCGRRDLIAAAEVNCQNFSDKYYSPIGRGMKVSKEQVIALITAIDLFVHTDHEAQWAAWVGQAQTIVGALQGIRGLRVCLEGERPDRMVPQAVVYFEDAWAGPSPEEVQKRLREGEPSVRIGRGGLGDELRAYVVTLEPGEEKIVAQRLREVLTGKRG